jgi:predicted secreted protein
VSRPIGPDDNGAVVRAAPGTVVTIRLPQRGGTGYRWSLEALPEGAELVGERSEGRRGFGAAPGAARERIFTVRVDQPVVLRARLRREWEPEEAAIDSFAVRIEVGPSA